MKGKGLFCPTRCLDFESSWQSKLKMDENSGLTEWTVGKELGWCWEREKIDW